MGRSWGIKATMLTRHITGTSAHFIGKSHTKLSKKSVHPLLTQPMAHQNEGLSRGHWEWLAKTEAWAIGHSAHALRLRLSLAADSRLRLASGSWARPGNHYFQCDLICLIRSGRYDNQWHSVKKEKSNLVGCSQLEVRIGSSGVEMTIEWFFAKFLSLFD